MGSWKLESMVDIKLNQLDMSLHSFITRIKTEAILGSKKRKDSRHS